MDRTSSEKGVSNRSTAVSTSSASPLPVPIPRPLPPIIFCPYTFICVCLATLFPFLALLWNHVKHRKAPYPVLVVAPPKRSATHWNWTMEGAWRTWRSAFSFTRPSPSLTFTQITDRIIAILQQDKLIKHPYFDILFRVCSTSTLILVLIIVILYHPHHLLELADPMIYVIRFWLLTIALWAASCATHTKGLAFAYDASVQSHKDYLKTIPVKCVHLDSVNGRDGPEDESVMIHVTDAYGVYTGVNATKKAKAADLEKNLAYVFTMAFIRAMLAMYCAPKFPFLFGGVHFILGAVFFGLTCFLEVELHEDVARWNIFGGLHDAQQSASVKLPFYLPLTSERGTDNIKAWDALRSFLRDCKGIYDFARLQLACAFIALQLLSISGFSLYMVSTSGASTKDWLGLIMADNLVIAFDSVFLIVFLSDIIRSGVKINNARGSHIGILRDAEIKCALQLTSLPLDDVTGRTEVSNSMQQLAAIRRRCAANIEGEKLTLFRTVKLDATIISILRGMALSYGTILLKGVLNHLRK